MITIMPSKALVADFPFLPVNVSWIMDIYTVKFVNV